MSDESFRVLELSLQGFNCSQILMIMALDVQGRADPALVRAMSGLVGGMGCGRTCGTLTGGCCVLGLYGGRGSDQEQEQNDLPVMLGELVDWFEARQGTADGSVDCADLVGEDPALRLSKCPKMITETFNKIMDILVCHGYSVDDPLAERLS